MTTRKENDLLTQVGPGTPGGDFFRRYWNPAALSEELPVGGAPLPIRLLGEDLVLFRVQSSEFKVQSEGRLLSTQHSGLSTNVGLLGIHCSHRGADLSYGRLEDGGLRCIYHGWLYDRTGRCLEQPGEPSGSTFYEKIRHKAYPCEERGGMIFAYMGPGAPPLFPNYDFLMGPPEHHLCSKYFQDDSYLQGSEGNVDPAHLGFLHRFFRPDEGDVRQGYHAGDLSPIIDPVETDWGLHAYAIRKVGTNHYIKVRSLVLPALTTVGSRGADYYLVNWHVPIDDEHHWRYGVSYSRKQPIEASERRLAREGLEENYHLLRNRANRYQQDREEMKTQTFIGLGKDFVLHDTMVTEGEGQIWDRTLEHLGYTDRAIVAMRKMMLRAIQDVQEGKDPPGVVREESQNDFVDVIARDDMLPQEIPWRWHWKSDRALAGVAG